MQNQNGKFSDQNIFSNQSQPQQQTQMQQVYKNLQLINNIQEDNSQIFCQQEAQKYFDKTKDYQQKIQKKFIIQNSKSNITKQRAPSQEEKNQQIQNYLGKYSQSPAQQGIYNFQRKPQNYIQENQLYFPLQLQQEMYGLKIDREMILMNQKVRGKNSLSPNRINFAQQQQKNGVSNQQSNAGSNSIQNNNSNNVNTISNKTVEFTGSNPPSNNIQNLYLNSNISINSNFNSSKINHNQGRQNYYQQNKVLSNHGSPEFQQKKSLISNNGEGNQNKLIIYNNHLYQQQNSQIQNQQNYYMQQTTPKAIDKARAISLNTSKQIIFNFQVPNNAQSKNSINNNSYVHSSKRQDTYHHYNNYQDICLVAQKYPRLNQALKLKIDKTIQKRVSSALPVQKRNNDVHFNETTNYYNDNSFINKNVQIFPNNKIIQTLINQQNSSFIDINILQQQQQQREVTTNNDIMKNLHVQLDQMQNNYSNCNNFISSKKQQQVFYQNALSSPQQLMKFQQSQEVKKLIRHREFVADDKLILGSTLADNSGLVSSTSVNQNPQQILIQKRKETAIQQQLMQQTSNLQSNLYKYIVCSGNNHELVKRIMESRDWWVEVPYHTQNFNFKWAPSNYGYRYDRLSDSSCSVKQCLNHFEGHKEITTKNQLIKNLKIYAETNKINLFDITPITFYLDLCEDSCEFQLNKFCSFFYKNLPKDHPKPDNIKKAIYDLKKNLKPIMSTFVAEKSQKSSQFTKPKLHPTAFSQGKYIWLLKPTGFNRGRGIQIFNTLEQFQQMLFEFCEDKVNPAHQEKSHNNNNNTQKDTGGQVNKSVELPGNTQEQLKNTKEQQMQTIVNNNTSQQIQLLEQNKDQITNTNNIIISNPLSNSQIIDKDNSNGNQVINQEKQQNQQSQQKQNNNSNAGNSSTDPQKNPIVKTTSFVIQKYIEDPMLIDQRKFDIRVWVLVTHNQEIYFFRGGYIRTSSEIFDINSQNFYVHLTNNAVQRFSPNYGQYEPGNLITFEQFDQYNKQKENGCDYFGKILPQIKQYCLLTFNSVRKKLNPEDRKYCMEIYGFDFIIDSQFQPWLIEVNVNPCIETTAEYLQEVIPRMLDDAFKLTIDQLFPKSKVKNLINIAHLFDQKNVGNNSQLDDIKIEQSITNLNLEYFAKQSQGGSNPRIDKQLPEDEANRQNNSKNLQVLEKTKSLYYQILDNSQNNSNDKQNDDLTKSLVVQNLNSYVKNGSSNNDNQNLCTNIIQNQSDVVNKLDCQNCSVKQTQLQQNKEENKPIKFSVKGVPDDENMWELIGSIPPTKPQNKRNQTRRFY